MTFSFGSAGQSSFGAPQQAHPPSSQSHRGPDLEDIQTEGIGFLSIAGDAKLYLLPTPWPSNDLPPPTSSLMSVAPQKGILAAAGPDVVIIATTESVRKAFAAPKPAESEIRPFKPQLAIPMNMRISQIAFTADESLLVLSAENGGGLAVYDVQKLLNHDTQSAFELSTNTLSLRSLVPNPTPEKADLLAVVTSDGNLMIANLKERTYLSGTSGATLKDGVSCISWSTKGKQLVAGLADGTAYQMTPEGEKKADIPRPPAIDANHHVSSITWLENNVFLMIHTASNFDSNSTQLSIFHIATRLSPSEFMFQKISDPAEPFGLNRSPPHHFLLRLRDYPPSIQDIIVVASTASTDIGLFTRSKVPMVADKPADKVTGVFTMTGMSDDSRRAILPMSAEEMSDTSPIGLALDLSSQTRVTRPIPKDEIDSSRTPLPGVMALNNEGVLAYWWVIYSDSIIQGTAYPGLVVTNEAAHQSTQPTPAQQTSLFAAAPKPTFGAPSNPSSAFSSFKSATPSFGPLKIPGSSTSTAFGAPSSLNQVQSVWGVPASTNSPNQGTNFGSPALGSVSGAGTGLSFGNAALPGSRVSPWATGTTKPLGSAFGQPSGLGSTSKPSMFGSIQSGGAFSESGNPTASLSGGFASFASSGGFAAAAAQGSQSGSIFDSNLAGSDFFASANSSEQATETSIGEIIVKEEEKPQGLFGGAGFTLGSTFKPDRLVKEDGAQSTTTTGSSFFGSTFRSALGEAQRQPVSAAPENLEADMDSEELAPISAARKDEPQAAAKSSLKSLLTESSAPTSTTVAPKFPLPDPKFLETSTPPKNFLPETRIQSSELSFGNISSALDQSPKSAPMVIHPTNIQNPARSEILEIKQEPQSDNDAEITNVLKFPEAPLPPDTTSKNSYAIGDSSVSSIEADAPLPPDPVKSTISKQTKPQETAVAILPMQIPLEAEPQSSGGLRGDPGKDADDSEDYVTEDEDDQTGTQSQNHSDAVSVTEEDGGEDVNEDCSPVSGTNLTPRYSPETSFSGTVSSIHSERILANASRMKPGAAPRGLFGEIQSKEAPILPPLKDLNLRSPSPVRKSIPGRLLRPDASRSVSAPGVASQLLGPQKMTTLSRQIPSFGNAISLVADGRKFEAQPNADVKPSKEAEQSQALIDEEDESVQKFLRREIVGTKKLDDFIAHQDYVGRKEKDSIPAQVEALYRDINSMIDTLGINSCSLKSFIKGHCERTDANGHTRVSLIGEDEWCLGELQSLSDIVEHQLADELEEGRIKDLTRKLEVCAALEGDLGKLQAKYNGVKMLVESQSNPDYLNLLRSKPMSADRTTQQNDLRADFTKVQKLLNEAEESLTVLRAQLVSRGGRGGNPTPGPTFEAVMKTIMKMTKMAEKRSGDIDVLENQMRKLGVKSSVSNGGREGSPFTTPAKASIRNGGTSSTSGLLNTPDDVRESQQGLHNSITSSVYSLRGTPPRKKLAGFTVEDKLRIKAGSTARKQITEKLKEALRKGGTRVKSMDDE